MSDYIKRQTACEVLDDLESYYNHEMHDPMMANGIGTARTKLSDIHSADVKPVVHAHWTNKNDENVYVCSNCGHYCREFLVRQSGNIPMQRFCTECGSIMDEEDKQYEKMYYKVTDSYTVEHQYSHENYYYFKTEKEASNYIIQAKKNSTKVHHDYYYEQISFNEMKSEITVEQFEQLFDINVKEPKD